MVGVSIDGSDVRGADFATATNLVITSALGVWSDKDTRWPGGTPPGRLSSPAAGLRSP
jgi:hypothetical protein